MRVRCGAKDQNRPAISVGYKAVIHLPSAGEHMKTSLILSGTQNARSGSSGPPQEMGVIATKQDFIRRKAEADKNEKRFSVVYLPFFFALLVSNVFLVRYIPRRYSWLYLIIFSACSWRTCFSHYGSIADGLTGSAFDVRVAKSRLRNHSCR